MRATLALALIAHAALAFHHAPWRARARPLVRMGVGNSFGRLFRISTWGESHGGGVGVTLDGCPPRVHLSRETIQEELDRRRMGSAFQEDPEEREDPPPSFPEMLGLAFDAELAVPENPEVQTKWVAGGIFDSGEFDKFVAARGLQKNEGLVMRHLLRFVLLAGEFHEQTGDPDYAELAEQATAACAQVDARYTETFLEGAKVREGLASDA